MPCAAGWAMMACWPPWSISYARMNPIWLPLPPRWA
jgi:hypothetical protein